MQTSAYDVSVWLEFRRVLFCAEAACAFGCCGGDVGLNAVHEPGVAPPVSPPTAMRRSFALPVVTAPVRMGLAVPVAVPEPSAIPDKSAHSETIEARSPGEGVPIKSSVSVADGLVPTGPSAITGF